MCYFIKIENNIASSTDNWNKIKMSNYKKKFVIKMFDKTNDKSKKYNKIICVKVNTYYFRNLYRSHIYRKRCTCCKHFMSNTFISISNPPIYINRHYLTNHFMIPRIKLIINSIYDHSHKTIYNKDTIDNYKKITDIIFVFNDQ